VAVALRPEDRLDEALGIARCFREQALVRLRGETEPVLNAEFLKEESYLANTQHFESSVAT
jgi:hypothetical protein